MKSIYQYSFITLSLMFLHYGGLTAQTSQDLFKPYGFFGINASVNYYEKGFVSLNQADSPVQIIPINYASYMYGGVFRLYHDKYFVLSSGVYFRRLVTQENIVHLEEGQISPINVQDFITYYEYQEFFPVIPVRIDFRVYRNFNVYASFDFGFYHRNAIVFSYENEDLLMENIFPETSHWYRSDVELGISRFIPSKFVLIQAYLYYNKSFQNTWDGDIYIEGIKNRNYTEVRGKMKESGNYWGLGVNLYPYKWWHHSE